jgi:abscisic acid receptor (PYR/PYL family)
MGELRKCCFLVCFQNYRSVVSLHEERADGERQQPCTLVVKSYVVDIPDGSTREDTELLIEALVNYNLKTLADVSERLAAAQGQQS